MRTVVQVEVVGRLTWRICSSSSAASHEDVRRSPASERPSAHHATAVHPRASLTQHPTASSPHKFIFPVVVLPNNTKLITKHLAPYALVYCISTSQKTKSTYFAPLPSCNTFLVTLVQCSAVIFYRILTALFFLKEKRILFFFTYCRLTS
jgi:hypothetical protein